MAVEDNTPILTLKKEVCTLVFLCKKKEDLWLTQMVRFLTVEPTYPGLNSGFDVRVASLRLIIFLVVGDVPVNNETLFDRLRKSQDQIGLVF
jgi:hypothetical protein